MTNDVAAMRGRLLSERYRLERPLAAGGMGEIWIATHLALERVVAVKLMSREAFSSDVLRARFEREAKACAQLRSPNVVQVYDYGIDGDVPYLVMELLEGDDLGAVSREKGRWTLEEAAPVIMQASRGLREAHQAGIVHRDIKLSNIFIARFGDERVVKLVDFGVARMLEPTGNQVTRAGARLGTTAYMSPEQLTGRPIDQRVDIWAMAVVAFRIVTASAPFDGATPGEVIESIVMGRRRRATEAEPTLPVEVDRFFDKAFAPDIAARFQTIDELAAAFAALAAGAASARAGAAPSQGVTRLERAAARTSPEPTGSAVTSATGAPTVLPATRHEAAARGHAAWPTAASPAWTRGATEAGAWTSHPHGAPGGPAPSTAGSARGSHVPPPAPGLGLGGWITVVLAIAGFGVFVVISTILGLASSARSSARSARSATEVHAPPGAGSGPSPSAPTVRPTSEPAPGVQSGF